MEKVSAVRCENYAGAEDAVRRAIRLAGGMPPAKTAFVKVNLLSASLPGEGVTTHPAVAKAVIVELQKKCGKVHVGDVPGFTSLEKAAKRSGIAEACEETGAELSELGDIRKYENPRAVLAKMPVLFSGAFGYGLLVNVPKLKTHALTAYTGAVKNLFGFVPPAQRKFYHLQYPDPVSFSRMLLDNYLLIRPGLNVMDGIVGMEGNGPSAGTTRNFNFISAGRDALALDAVCASLLGIEKKVPLLNIARKTGLKNAFLEKIDREGDDIAPISDLALPKGSIVQMPAPFLKLARNHLTAKPYAQKEKCTGCGTCAKACPAEAIRMEEAQQECKPNAGTLNAPEAARRNAPDKKPPETMTAANARPTGEIGVERTSITNVRPQKFPAFDYWKCIRCYTCQEMCPSKAIELYENSIVRAARSAAKKIRRH